MGVTSLLFAGVSGLMAFVNTYSEHPDYTYTQVKFKTLDDVDVKGSNATTGVTNYHWAGETLDLTEDARYEFWFRVSL
ncbi:MAG: hypothetical protein J6L64_08685 [Opitutales bacterium]|nr:hypothetical protein [Opitutales bacterium]